MEINKKRVKRIIMPILLLVVVGGLYYLISNEIVKINSSFIKVTGIIFTLILSLLIAAIIIRLTSSKVWNMFEKEMEVEQRIIISKLYSMSLYAIAFFITFWKAGVSLGDITLFVGLIATGFAYSIRELLLSFFAWFIILNKKPFHMGDYIHIVDETGLVTRIGTFFFTIEQRHPDEYLKIPNSLILSKPIRNLGAGKYREELKIRLEQIPSDIQAKMSELGEYIKSRNPYRDNIKIQLNNDNDGWYISVSYYTSYTQENLKPALLMQIQKMLAGSLKISNRF